MFIYEENKGVLCQYYTTANGSVVSVVMLLVAQNRQNKVCDIFAAAVSCWFC